MKKCCLTLTVKASKDISKEVARNEEQEAHRNERNLEITAAAVVETETMRIEHPMWCTGHKKSDSDRFVAVSWDCTESRLHVLVYEIKVTLCIYAHNVSPR